MPASDRLKGFTSVAVLVALLLLTAMATSVVILVATNQSSSTKALHMSQAVESSYAGLEYAMRLIMVNGNPSVMPTRYFKGSAWLFTRANNTLQVASTFGSAHNTFSILDPNPSFCIHALAPTGANGVSTDAESRIQIPTCAMAVNSSHASALALAGSSNITAAAIQVVGSYSLGSSATVTTHSGSVQTGTASAPDPLLSYSVPFYSACDYPDPNINGIITTLNPGVYCGLTIRGSSIVTLNPGTYIIDANDFLISNTATVTGTDVVIILGGTLTGTYAKLRIANSGTLTLTAPTTGTYTGIAIFQDRNAPNSESNIISGSAQTNISGTVYLPNQPLEYRNTAAASGPCAKVIVYQLKMTGSAVFSCS